MHHHGKSTVRPTLTYHIHTSKKTGTLTDLPHQPHERQHHLHRPEIPKQPPQISPSQNMNIALKKIVVAAIKDQ